MHLKRLAAPVEFKVPRKRKKFIVRPVAGPHSLRESIPVAILLRDKLNLAASLREVKFVLNWGEVSVDGKVVKDYHYPVGLMDVIYIKSLEKHYRLLPVTGKGLEVIEIDPEEADHKLCMVIRKQHVKGGGLQLTLHDGKNLIYRGADIDAGRKVKVGDTLKVRLSDQQVLDHLPMTEGKYGLVIRGGKRGLHGVITKIDRTLQYPARKILTLRGQTGSVSTLLSHVMVVGDERSWVRLP
ncbi:MAG: 30S ribosomal protein S4e [Aigarchaeota archaeon]|nr:30S ribosomal protein S4e [Aigarchaeota archaeon]MDW8092207.1 30S ribosomal protein S4e [Nitrososphaerota archaeon]